jgi:hypothetical protein
MNRSIGGSGSGALNDTGCRLTNALNVSNHPVPLWLLVLRIQYQLKTAFIALKFKLMFYVSLISEIHSCVSFVFLCKAFEGIAETPSNQYSRF